MSRCPQPGSQPDMPEKPGTPVTSMLGQMSEDGQQLTGTEQALLADRRAAKKIERADAAKVMRIFARRLAALGFHRKSTFFARPAGPVIQFLHVHKYSFGGSFRIHVCIRVANSPRPFIGLLGITEQESELPQRFGYSTGNAISVTACADHMATFVETVAEQWFRSCTPLFLNSMKSFLPEEDRHHLEEDLKGNGDPEAIALSFKLLGLAQPSIPPDDPTADSRRQGHE